jgi:4-amino-4-deoxy-L-arabinose transferase-like glycosyltransferase
VFVAFLIRLLHVLSYDPWPTNDMAVFVDMAVRRLTMANLFEPAGLCRYPPGYALFLKPFLLAAEPATAFTAIRIAQAALGAISCLLIYRLARRLHSRRAGLAAALLAAFFTHFLFYSSAYMSENLFVPLLLGTLLAFIRAAQRGSIRRLYTAGLLAGAAALVRPAAVSLAPVAIYAAWRWAASRKLPLDGRYAHLARGLQGLALISAGGLTLIAPWTVRNWIALGEPVLIAPTASFNLAVGNNPDATGWYMDVDPPEGDQAFASAGPGGRVLDFVTGDPWGALYLTARLKWRAFWAGVPPWPLYSNNPALLLGEIFVPVISWRVAFFLGMVGLGVLAAGGRSLAWVTASCFLAYVGYYMVFFGQPRFRMPAEAYFLAWGGAALAVLLGRLPLPRARQAGAWAAATSILLVSVVTESAASAVFTRAHLRRANSLAASGSPLRVPPRPRVVPLFEMETIPLDRTRGRYLRLSLLARRAGPDRTTPSNDSIQLTFLHDDGEPRSWINSPRFYLDSLPPDRWAPVKIKVHIPPSAASVRIDLLPDRGSPDILRVEHAALRYSSGNDPALEFLFPYLRYRE